jgi:hypothetical protein
MNLFSWLCALSLAALARTAPGSIRPEPGYRFSTDVQVELAHLTREHPGLIGVRSIGLSVKERPIMAYTLRDPREPARHRVLVLAQIHAMEWVPTEVAVDYIQTFIAQPIPGVELVVVPMLNIDGRVAVEQDLLAGRNIYRRGNANHVDLNRDFAINREALAIWRHVLPGYYQTSPSRLSQPESQAVDRLAAEQHFDVALSFHAFGGYIYHPWAGLYERPPAWDELDHIGRIMASGQGRDAYQVKQLARWAFFFRGHGMEMDHMYGTYGTRSFLIEMTHSGLELRRPATLDEHFRWYNPRDPDHHTAIGVSIIRNLVGWLASLPEGAVGRDRPPPGRGPLLFGRKPGSGAESPAGLDGGGWRP